MGSELTEERIKKIEKKFFKKEYLKKEKKRF